jgi:DNA-binding NarL/FixJ family response regulator
MSKQVPWNKVIVEEFISEAMLTQEEEMILRTRVKGWSRTKQSIELGMSLSSVDKHIAMLKKKYDNVQKYDPLLPPRRMSAEETWMDNN